MTGYHNHIDKLWDIPVNESIKSQIFKPVMKPLSNILNVMLPSPQHKLGVIIRRKKTKITLAKYMHETLGIHPIETL